MSAARERPASIPGTERPPRILVTGATGYVGGRLVERLLGTGHQVRVLARDPERARARSWSGQVEIVGGDLLEPDSLPPALEGVDVAYYLVHSMASGEDFEERDRRAARNFIHAASALRQVIYLGGILPRDDERRARSSHLESRGEIGRILSESLPTTEFRAGPVIGSGSASFSTWR